jgi:phospholipid/cholesterol/gamma-HCH transport system substrate-binding protein
VKGLSLEAKVGILLLVALLLMGGFLFVLGGVNLKSGFTVYVDFNHPGGLKPGAAVRVAGVRVGTVEASQYLGGKLDPATGRRPMVRMELRVDEEVRPSLHEDALFYVTSSGVLGEPFLAIDPGDPEKPILSENTVYAGVDPPRLDLALALGYELLQTMVNAVRNNRDELESLLHNASGVLAGMNEVLGKNKEQINAIINNLVAVTDNGNKLLVSVKDNYVEGPQAKRIMSNLDRTLTATSQNTAPLLQDARGVINDARDVLGPEQRQKIKSAISDAQALASSANTTLADAKQIVGHMKRGEGTVGALLMDEEIYDDVQEMLRDLKHNPWKLFWRE